MCVWGSGGSFLTFLKNLGQLFCKSLTWIDYSFLVIIFWLKILGAVLDERQYSLLLGHLRTHLISCLIITDLKFDLFTKLTSARFHFFSFERYFFPLKLIHNLPNEVIILDAHLVP